MQQDMVICQAPPCQGARFLLLGLFTHRSGATNGQLQSPLVDCDHTEPLFCQQSMAELCSEIPNMMILEAAEARRVKTW